MTKAAPAHHLFEGLLGKLDDFNFTWKIIFDVLLILFTFMVKIHITQAIWLYALGKKKNIFNHP